MQRRKVRIGIILLLLLVLIVSGATAIYYWRTRSLPSIDVTAAIEELELNRPHYVFSIYGFLKPTAVAVSPDSNRIFVAEAGGEGLIHTFDKNGDFVRSFALPGTTKLTREPGGIAVSSDNRVYVADGRRRDIAIYTLDGEFIDFFVPDNDPDFDWLPVGLTFDNAGNLYVTDHKNPRHQVLGFDPSGKLITQFGYYGVGEGMFNFPRDVAVSDNGTIYVTDSNNSRLQIFDGEGNLLLMLGGFSLPRSVSFDSYGRLHVLDSMEHKVTVFSMDGAPGIEFSYGNMGIEMGELYYPSDLALDGGGRVYITDYLNNRLQVWEYNPPMAIGSSSTALIGLWTGIAVTLMITATFVYWWINRRKKTRDSPIETTE